MTWLVMMSWTLCGQELTDANRADVPFDPRLFPDCRRLTDPESKNGTCDNPGSRVRTRTLVPTQ
jgi:hypothetical protein